VTLRTTFASDASQPFSSTTKHGHNRRSVASSTVASSFMSEIQKLHGDAGWYELDSFIFLLTQVWDNCVDVGAMSNAGPHVARSSSTVHACRMWQPSSLHSVAPGCRFGWTCPRCSERAALLRSQLSSQPVAGHLLRAHTRTAVSCVRRHRTLPTDTHLRPVSQPLVFRQPLNLTLSIVEPSPPTPHTVLLAAPPPSPLSRPPIRFNSPFTVATIHRVLPQGAVAPRSKRWPQEPHPRGAIHGHLSVGLSTRPPLHSKAS